MTSKGTICITIEIFPPIVIGGAELSTHLAAKALATSGYRVVVLTPHYKGEEIEHDGQLTVIRFPYPKWIPVGDNLYFTNPLFYFYLGCQIIKAHKKYKFDFIHAHHTYSIIGSFFAAKILRKRFFVTLRDTKCICIHGANECLARDKHSYVPYHEDGLPPVNCKFVDFYRCYTHSERIDEKLKKKKFLKRFFLHARKILESIDCKLRHFSLRRSTNVISVSDALGAKYKKALALDNISTIYNLPPVLFSEKSENPYWFKKLLEEEKQIVLYVGAISINKGCQCLIDAMFQVQTVVPNVFFVFVGKVYDDIKSNDMVDPYCYFTGHLKPSDVQKYFINCSIVVVPSITDEAFGRSALEGAMHGKPVIVTRNGGLVEIIEDKVNGLVVESGDVVGLSNAIISILNSKSLRDEFKDNSEKIIASKFSVGAILERYNLIYSIVEDPPPN